jgi:alanine dehydrogenase
LTPSREWYLKKEWIKPGIHINAVGADAKGKEELDPDILNMAKVVVDDVYQSTEAGEVNVPISKGLYKGENIYATLCDLAGGKPGRQNEQEITVFDSTGLAIEDIAVAKMIYDKAKDRGDILSVDMLG